MRRPRRQLFLNLASSVLLGSCAVADDTAAGLALVETNCGGCHAVGAEGPSPMVESPPFRVLHLRYDVEFLSEALVEGIMTGHEAMPEFVFTPDEAAAIVAYLKSLE